MISLLEVKKKLNSETSMSVFSRFEKIELDTWNQAFVTFLNTWPCQGKLREAVEKANLQAYLTKTGPAPAPTPAPGFATPAPAAASGKSSLALLAGFGEVATAGCYVRYPAEDLLDIVCLESHRAQAVVVGEDLGTVEDGVLEALAERNIASYRVLWFEDDEPSTWPALSLATVTTHDLPTVAGLWSGSDVDDVLASSDMAESDVRAGRAELLERLGRAGVAPGAPVSDVVAAAYRRLGGAGSLLLALSLEDALLEQRRPNVPGTTADQRDNWSIPLPVPLDHLSAQTSPAALLAGLRAGQSGD